MIDFYSATWQTSNQFTGVNAGGLWMFEAKVKAYKTVLRQINEQMISALELRMAPYEALDPNIPEEQALITLHFSSYNTVKTWRDLLKYEDPIQYIFEGEAGLYTEEPVGDGASCTTWMDYRDPNKSCGINMFKVLLSRTKPTSVEAPMPPEMSVGEAFSHQVSKFHDDFYGRFHEYYMMARQLNNFDCKFLPTFRALYVFMSGMRTGVIFSYFDYHVNDLATQMQDIVNYIYALPATVEDPPGSGTFVSNWEQNLIDTANKYIDFLTIKSTKGGEISTGITDFTQILVASKEFVQGLPIGIRVVSTANIVLTASSDDDPILSDQAANTVGIIDPELINPVDESATEYRIQLWMEMRAASYVASIGLQMKQYINRDFSNFEMIVSKTIAIGLEQTGIINRLTNINNLIGIYGLPYTL